MEFASDRALRSAALFIIKRGSGIALLFKQRPSFLPFWVSEAGSLSMDSWRRIRCAAAAA